jgi:hypothetical protein
MSHCGLDDCWEVRGFIHPVKKSLDPSSELVSRWRRDEARLIEAATRRPDNDDSITESASVAELSNRASDKRTLKLTEHSDGERAILGPRKRQFRHPLEVQNPTDLSCHMPQIVGVCGQNVGEWRIGSL